MEICLCQRSILNKSFIVLESGQLYFNDFIMKITFSSSQSQMFWKLGLLKDFAKFTVKH